MTNGTLALQVTAENSGTVASPVRFPHPDPNPGIRKSYWAIENNRVSLPGTRTRRQPLKVLETAAEAEHSDRQETESEPEWILPRQGGGSGRLQVRITESIIDDRVAFKNGGEQTATSEEGILIIRLDLVSVSQTEKVSITRLA